MEQNSEEAKVPPAVTRRKEFDQTTFGQILSYGMLGANLIMLFQQVQT